VCGGGYAIFLDESDLVMCIGIISFHSICRLLTLFFHYIHTLSGSESGKMCAMKEVTLFSDDPKSKENVK